MTHTCVCFLQLIFGDIQINPAARKFPAHVSQKSECVDYGWAATYEVMNDLEYLDLLMQCLDWKTTNFQYEELDP